MTHGLLLPLIRNKEILKTQPTNFKVENSDRKWISEVTSFLGCSGKHLSLHVILPQADLPP